MRREKQGERLFTITGLNNGSVQKRPILKEQRHGVWNLWVKKVEEVETEEEKNAKEKRLKAAAEQPDAGRGNRALGIYAGAGSAELRNAGRALGALNSSEMQRGELPGRTNPSTNRELRGSLNERRCRSSTRAGSRVGRGKSLFVAEVLSMKVLVTSVFAVCLLASGAVHADSKVVNKSSSKIRVYWTAAGCAGIKDGFGYVCAWKDVAARRSAKYKFKWGTTGLRVSANCVNDASGWSQAQGSPKQGWTTSNRKTHHIKCGTKVNPNSPAVPEGTFMIINQRSALCLGLGKLTLGARAGLNKCDGSRRQAFTSYKRMLRSAGNPKLCLGLTRRNRLIAGNCAPSRGKITAGLTSGRGWRQLKMKGLCLIQRSNTVLSSQVEMVPCKTKRKRYNRDQWSNILAPR